MANVPLPAHGQRAHLTNEGRRLLEDRVRQLEVLVDDLREALQDPERDDEAVQAHLRARDELDRLSSALVNARSTEETADDPRVVEIGDTVDIRLDDGTDERYLIVHAIEAAMDDERISLDSPLAAALLGRRVGEFVEVTSPSGTYRCLIMSASRQKG